MKSSPLIIHPSLLLLAEILCELQVFDRPKFLGDVIIVLPLPPISNHTQSVVVICSGIELCLVAVDFFLRLRQERVTLLLGSEFTQRKRLDIAQIAVALIVTFILDNFLSGD